jgi:hypothetical protein
MLTSPFCWKPRYCSLLLVAHWAGCRPLHYIGAGTYGGVIA